MKNDLNDLKKLTLELMNQDISKEEKEGLIQKIYGNDAIDNKKENILTVVNPKQELQNDTAIIQSQDNYSYAETIEAEEPLSLLEKEIEMIKKALERSNGKRKLAAEELGISERTLYRKIKQYDLNEDEI
jgi:DNA-binding NtrC family response regulator